jgi:hypothetical protein
MPWSIVLEDLRSLGTDIKLLFYKVNDFLIEIV